MQNSEKNESSKPENVYRRIASETIPKAANLKILKLRALGSKRPKATSTRQMQRERTGFGVDPA